MTINEQVIQALEPLGYPVVPDRYTGDEKIYLTFNYGSRGGLFSDDAPQFDICMLQVHLFAPHGANVVALRGSIRQRLFAAGFTWPEVTDAGAGDRTQDPEGQHIVFECEIEAGVALDG